LTDIKEPFFKMLKCDEDVTIMFKPESGDGRWWLSPIILATQEAEIRRITIQSQPGQIVFNTPISKITRANWSGAVAYVVECLLCKCLKFLNSNPTPTKNQNKIQSGSCL
jgi:hypothetical protein